MGGMKAAMDLAESGMDVVIIDKAFSIGGLMTQLDRTFPTNNCDLCTLSPYLAESSRMKHIDLMPSTTLTMLEGDPGRFSVTLTMQPRFIDLNRCTACGECLKQFPGCVRFTPGLDHRAPTCMRYPQATPYAFSIDMEKCEDIDALSKVCHAEAIIPDDREKEIRLEVGSIILAPGAELLDPSILTNYGYGVYPNVVTGLEYERILSASGPTGGMLVRPSDNNPPKKIAWIQCAGSRSYKGPGVPYCSSVCCMYALKEAMVTKERFQDNIETVIFFMDMRTFGKDYELYYQRAKNDFNVRFKRSRPHSIEPVGGGQDLSITYIDEESGRAETEIFDMAVLSTGFRVQEDLIALADSIGIELNEHNFAATDYFHPVETNKKGIYVCGLFESPKDIPETMVQASAAACLASGDLDLASTTATGQDDYPPERDVSNEEPKIGVFICDCGYDIGSIIDVNELAEYGRKLPQVILSETVGHGCSKESLERIRQAIIEKGLNRVVLAGCSPRTHEALFQDTVRRAGLNRYLFEMANIRDQDTWVHHDQPLEASHKAKDLIRMAAASVALTSPLTEYSLAVNKDVLVVGGGVSGMNASLCLADQGFRVFLVEKGPELGGVAKDIRRSLEGDDVQGFVKDLIERTKSHERIQVLTRALIVDHFGMPGLFTTGLQIGPRMYYRQIRHGATILATGSMPNRPQEYLLGAHEAVVTQMDLDGILEDDEERVRGWKRVVMIQCVGSRSPENPNCSRICCQSAIKNALRIRNVNPEAQIIILYRDMRTYGLQEDYYRKARTDGILFARYDENEKPTVKTRGEEVVVTFRDRILDREIEISADCLALSTGLMADDEATEDLAAIFHLPRTGDGYFLEDHVKLRPVDLPVPGFFVAGTAHSPKSVKESISQAQAAAGRARALLVKDTINLGASVAKVDANKCAACLICVRACPFDVPFINADGHSEIDPAKCHGCGVCAAECPARAIQLMQFEDDRIMAKLTGLLEEVI